MSRSFRIEGQELSTRFNDLVIGGALVSDEAPVDGQLMRYDASTRKWRPHDPSGGAGGLLTAVVDIGPTTNTGPGPNNVGIKNWSASPIVIVAAPGAGKFNHVINISVQCKPGASAYLDPNAGAAELALFYSGSQFSIIGTTPAAFGLLTLTPSLFPDAQLFVSGSPGTLPSAQTETENQAMLFGFLPGQGALELTTGDGQVRITVHYSVDEILV